MTVSAQKITPCLCFNDQAEQAVDFYLSVFPDGHITGLTRCGEDEPGGPPGSVRTIAFQLFGQDFLAVNGGPHFQFNDGISLMVNCDTQQELDRLWAQLSAGGQTIQCGWLQDPFGVSWQITPRGLEAMLLGPDPARAQRVMNALLGMVKLDIAALKRAYDGLDEA